MQKTFTADFLTGRRTKNVGRLDSYLAENAHEPIIGREMFELVQRNIKNKPIWIRVGVLNRKAGLFNILTLIRTQKA